MNNIEDTFKFKENRSNLKISFSDSFYFLSFSYTIFCSKTIYLSLKKNHKNPIYKEKKVKFRASIMDRDGNIIAKTVRVTNLGMNPNQLINKDKILISLKLIFPEKNFKSQINDKKFFYIKKKYHQKNLKKLIYLVKNHLKKKKILHEFIPMVISLVIYWDRSIQIITVYQV